MPHAYVIIFIMTVITAILANIIPAGTFDRVEDASGNSVVVADSFHHVDKIGCSIFDMFKSFQIGFEDSAQIIFFIIFAYAFVYVLLKNGTFDALVGSVLRKVGNRIELIIPVCMILFGLLGSTMGMFEETYGLIPVFISIAMALGYDAIVGGSALFVANYLVPKYGGFTNEELYVEYVFWVVVLSALATLLAVIGIWKKDQPGRYEHQQTQKIKVWDFFLILKQNKPIRMLIMAACTNRFAATVYSHTTVGVMLYGIMMENYGIAGWIGVVAALPTLLVVTVGIRAAQRMGQKKALVLFTGLGIFFQLLLIVVLMQDNINTVTFNLKHFNAISFWFMLFFVLLNGCKSITNNMVVPMIADCSDYEQYRSGKFVPGLMGALFSFVDKIFAALGTAFVGLVMLLIGYNKTFPQIGDALTPVLRYTTIFLFCGTPIIGWVSSLIALKFYRLDKKKMNEIAAALQEEEIK